MALPCLQVRWWLSSAARTLRLPWTEGLSAWALTKFYESEVKSKSGLKKKMECSGCLGGRSVAILWAFLYSVGVGSLLDNK